MSRKINRINFTLMIAFGVVLIGFGVKIYSDSQDTTLLLFGMLFLVLGIVGAKLFWNRDSRTVSIGFSWDIWSKKDKNGN